MWYMLKGKQIIQMDTLEGWISWRKGISDAEMTIGRDIIEGCLVSTVFLGLDHNFCGGPPLVFETMVFRGPLDQEQVRYSTYTAAEAGHRRMVDQVKAAHEPAEKSRFASLDVGEK